MKCAKARKWISDEIDNGLVPDRKRVLEEHLRSCPKCLKLRENLRKIKAAAGELKEFSPSGEAWFKIASQIKRQQPGTERPALLRQKRLFWSPRVLGWTAAVLLLIAVAATVVLGPGIRKKEPGSQDYVLSKLEEAERHYQRAIEALWQAVSSQRDHIDPQLYAVFQKNLDIIDQSILACKAAVLSRPDNIDSRNYLLAAYREKRNLLEEMMAADSSPVEQRDVGSIY